MEILSLSPKIKLLINVHIPQMKIMSPTWKRLSDRNVMKNLYIRLYQIHVFSSNRQFNNMTIFCFNKN